MSWAIERPRALFKTLTAKVSLWARGASPADGPARQPTVRTATAESTRSAPAAEALNLLRLRPEVERSLLDAGMPPEGSSLYEGPKRAADTPETAARKFVMWAQAVGAFGTHSTRTVAALYWECADVDHREPLGIDRLLRALKTTRGARQETSTTDRRRQVWVIDPPEPPRVPKAQEAIAAKIAARAPHLHPRVLQRLAPELDESSPQLMRAMAHDARRQGRARKQRGSRNVRWAS